MKKKSKPRIALLGMGTLDSGFLGVPVIIDLFDALSSHFDIVFYSFIPFNQSSVSSSIKVRQPVSWRIPGRVKYVLVAVRCIWDHFLNPFSLFFAVSIYPTGLCAVLLGKILRRPSIVQLIALEAANLRDINLGYLSIPWLRKITIRVCRDTEVLIVVSEYQRDIARKSLPTSRAIEVLPLRVDIKKFPYRKREVAFPVQFIHIAFYSILKDQDTLFTAFASVAKAIDCHLTVIGNGYEVPKIRNMMLDMEIADKVTFTGFVKHEELPTYFSRAHILLHSSRFEAEPIVIQEAMASGVLVCGTDVGTLADIGERYAVIVPPGNAGLMAEKILQVVHNPSSFEKITDEAYRWISLYDSDWSHKNYKSVFERMISKSL